MTSPLLVLLLLASAGSQKAPLYGIITEVIDDGTSTAIFSISVDPQTGAIKNVTEDFFVAGGSATIDGVSALDVTSGVYIYATDTMDAYAHETNVYSGTLLPSLDFGARAILHFTSDVVRSRFLVLVADQTNAFKIYAVDATDGETTMFAAAPPAAVLTVDSSAAVNDRNGYYYLVAASKANVTDPEYRVFTMSSSGSLVATSAAIDIPGFVVRVHYDAVNGSLVGVLELFQNGRLLYFVAHINPQTGKASYSKVSSILDGIVTSVTFSQSKRILYFCEARNGVGGVLHAWDVTTGKETTVNVADYYVLESLEASG